MQFELLRPHRHLNNLDHLNKAATRIVARANAGLSIADGSENRQLGPI